MRIYKVSIPLEFGLHTVKIQFGSVIRSCQRQRDNIVIYFECGSTVEEERQVYVVPTGGTAPDDRWAYLSTIITDPLVYHVYLLK